MCSRTYRGSDPLVQGQIGTVALPLVAAFGIWLSGQPLILMFALPLWMFLFLVSRTKVEIRDQRLHVHNPAQTLEFDIAGLVVQDTERLGLHPGALCVMAPDGRYAYCWGLGRKLLPFGPNDLAAFKADVCRSGARENPTILRYGEKPGRGASELGR